MRTKGKPSCGGTGCDPCNSDTNPCFVLTVEAPVTIVLDEPPTDYTVEPMEEFLPADLPRDSRYVCLWNSTSGKYECNYLTPGPTDTVYSIDPLTIADRYAGDTPYRSVQYDHATSALGGISNLCKGKRWYGGAANQYPVAWGGSTFEAPADCTYDETGGTAGYCNWGVLPGHVGDMSTGPWSPTLAVFFKWTLVTVSGVKKVRIVVRSGEFDGWFAETNFYRAASTPTAPVFWWPIPADDPIRLAFTPTLQDDGSAPLDNPLPIVETLSFHPWPDILLTSCDNTFPPCDAGCYPECLKCPEIASLALVIEEDPSCCLSGTFNLHYNSADSGSWQSWPVAAPGDPPTTPGVEDRIGGPDGVCGIINWLVMSCGSDDSHVNIQFNYTDVNGGNFTVSEDVACSCTPSFESDYVTVPSNPFAPGLCEGGFFIGSKLRIVAV